MVDNSIYKKEHDKVVEYVKQQIGIDLNRYRDGDGTSPYATTYWDLHGPEVCINWCGSVSGMEVSIQNSITNFVNKTKGKLVLEWGGAWFKYIYLKQIGG